MLGPLSVSPDLTRTRTGQAARGAGASKDTQSQRLRHARGLSPSTSLRVLPGKSNEYLMFPRQGQLRILVCREPCLRRRALFRAARIRRSASDARTTRARGWSDGEEPEPAALMTFQKRWHQ